MAGRARLQRSIRLRRRLPVQFGRGAPLREGGFTSNVSLRGLGITSPQVHPPGTRLTVEVRLPSGERAALEGTVAWAQRGMPQLGLPGTMGVRLTSLHAGFHRFVTGTDVVPATSTQVVVPSPPPSVVPAAPVPTPVELAPASVPPPAVDPGDAGRPAPSAEAPRVAVPRVPRFVDRLPVRYGTLRDVNACRGFTLDVSRTGVGLSGFVLALTGTRLQLTVTMADGRLARADGNVVWTRRPDGDTTGVMGLSLRFTDALWLQLVDDAARNRRG